MKDFETFTRHARERVETTQVPPSLYSRAEFRKNAIDSLITIALASLVVSLSTIQSSHRVAMEPPAVKKYVAQELVASKGLRP